MISCGAETVTAGDQPAPGEGVGVAASSAGAPTTSASAIAPPSRLECVREGQIWRACNRMTPSVPGLGCQHQRESPRVARGKSLTLRDDGCRGSRATMDVGTGSPVL
jgi:hypothetical protein